MKLMASTLLVVTMATGAIAQTREAISRDCLKLVEAGDMAAASVLVERMILNKNRALSAQTAAYELKCINAVKDEPYAMDTVLGGYATLSALKTQSAANRKSKAGERKKQLEARKAGREGKAAERQRKAAIMSRAHQACVQLAADDHVAAYTNKMCVDLFLEVGAPDAN